MSALRDGLRDRLARGAFAEALALDPGPRLARGLVSLLCDPEELLRWGAVSAIGRLAAADPERARPLVNRLLWSLTDESGGIGWSSTPALGEIGRNAPALVRDCILVVTHYLEEPMLLPGVLWAIGRLAPAYPRETRAVAPELAALLGDASPAVRAQAAVALGEIGDDGARGPLGRLLGDGAVVRVYRDDELVGRTVAEWARDAVAALGPEPREDSHHAAGATRRTHTN